MTATDDGHRLGEARARARDAAMRADIHLLGDLLGDTLVRQHGAELLELVERVRSLSKQARDPGADDRAAADLDALLAGLDIADITNLVRAFSTFFQLANVAEQTHRVDEHGPRSGIARGRLRALFDHIREDEAQRAALREVAGRIDVRPVFTAHPTEAARRSVLTKLQRIGELLYDRADPRQTAVDQERIRRRIAEAIDLIWQTDELRVNRPTPVDEARAAIYYLEELLRGVSGDLFDELDAQLERVGVELPAHARTLHFGSWVGGDRDGNPRVTADVTTAVLELQHDRALAELVRADGRTLSGAQQLRARATASRRSWPTACAVTPRHCRQPTGRRGAATPARATGSSWRSCAAGWRTRAGASPSTPATCRATTT